MIHLKLTIMAFLWAGGFIAGKVVASQAGPFTITFFRFFISTLVLAGLVYKKEQYTSMNVKLFAYALCAAFLGIFCYNYLFFTGIQFIEAGRGSVIVSTVPIIVALLSFVLFKEQVNKIKIIGILFSILGAWVVISKGEASMIWGQSIGRGEMLMIGCVICAAAFTLCSKKMLHSLSPMVTIVYISAIGTAFVFGPALMELTQTPFEGRSYSFILNLLYLAIGPSVIAVIFYYEAINIVGAARASQYMNLMPVFAVILAVIFFGESVTVSLLIGGALVSMGLFLTNFKTLERR